MIPSRIALLVLLLTSSSAIAQSPAPRIVTSKEFLGANMEVRVYDIETDSRGYVYMATNGSVHSFNGSDLRMDNIHYGEDVAPMFYAIDKDYDGDLWFSGRLGIAFLENDSLLAYPIPDSTLKFARQGFESVYQDKNDLLHIAPRCFGHYTVDSKGSVSEIMTRYDTDIHGYVVTQLDDGSWFHYYIRSDSKKESVISVYYLNEKNELKKITETDERVAIYESSLVQHADNSLSLSIGSKTLIQFKRDQLINQKKIDFDIIKLFVDSKNDLWIGTLQHGAIQAKNSNLSDFTTYSNGNMAIVAESYNGGLWCKTDGIRFGFGYIPPSYMRHYSEQSGYDEINRLTTVNNINGQICFSGKNGKLLFLDGNSIEQLDSRVSDYPIHGNQICYDKESRTYWLASGEVIVRLCDDKLSLQNLNDSDYYRKSVVCLKNFDGRILGMTNSNLFEIKNNEIVTISEISNRGSLRDFTMDDQGNFWFATESGITLLKDSTFTSLPYQVPDELNGEISFVFFAQGYIWAGCLDQTLIKLNQKTCQKVVDQSNDPVKIWNFAIGDDDIIWGINSELKLIRIKESTFPNQVIVDKFELPKHSTRASTMFSIAILDKTIYLGSKHGLFEIKIKDLKREAIPSKLNFKLLINSENIEFANHYALNYWENELQIEFDAINFEQSTITFSYMLEGYDETWKETKYKLAHYTNLPPGVYRLKLRSKTRYGKWSQPEVITFNISAPYWQTWWFRTIIVLSTLALIFVILKWRIKQVQRREKEKSKIALELARLEMRALKAQINPHFIFNSITSAMYYLAKNENDKVESYLQRFSKLVRRVLESSDQSIVRLVEEMELIRLYVKLESEQFKGEPISINVIYKGKDIEKVKIPPTLIQPYIENAIQHGLRNKSGKRLIKLSFQINQDELNVQIQDNGIGRVAAQKETPFKDSKSYGMLISSKRIELLNQNNFSVVTVDDLYDESGNAEGTRVIFNIPLVNSSIPLNDLK
jgi:hypothetical protein